jgi:hypothetical protein
MIPGMAFGSGLAEVTVTGGRERGIVRQGVSPTCMAQSGYQVMFA